MSQAVNSEGDQVGAAIGDLWETGVRVYELEELREILEGRCIEARTNDLNVWLTIEGAGTLLIPEEALVSITHPLQPATVNPVNYKKLSGKKHVAKAWRHGNTHWYDREQQGWLVELSRTDERLADALRVILEATFVVAAEAGSKLRKGAYQRLEKECVKFVQKYDDPLTNADEMLDRVRPWSYFVMKTELLLSGAVPTPRVVPR